SGRHMRLNPRSNALPAGITPTTVYGSPSSVSVRPTRAGSDPNRVAHSAWLSTSTCSRPGWSSPGWNARPRAGAILNTSKYPAETRPVRMSVGSPTPDSVIDPPDVATNDWNTLADA